MLRLISHADLPPAGCGPGGKVKGYEGHDGLEEAVGKPEGAEGRQDHHDGHNDEVDIVLFHG